MKTIRSLVLIATLAVACPLFGQITNYWVAPPYVLPPSLPIGDEDTIRNWAVSRTNGLPNQWSAVTLYYYTAGGQYANIQHNSPIAFDTYEQYTEWVAGTAMDLAGILSTNGLCPSNANIGFWSNVSYNTALTGYPSTSIVGLMEASDFGPLSTLSSNQFAKVRPSSETIVLSVPQMTYLRIDISTNVPCWYVWDKGVATSTNWPAIPWESTVNGFPAFNEWYCLTNFRTRFTMGTTGAQAKTNVYTQHGDIVITNIIPIIHPNRLDLNIPRGADVLVETSFDLKNWTTLTNLPWSLGTNFTSIAVNPIHQRQFYRATAR